LPSTRILLSAYVCACLAAAAPGAAAAQPRASAPLVFEAPSGRAPAGPLSPVDTFGRVLPSGRYLHPTGADVVTGMNALGLALSPDGRYAVVSNDDERQATTASLLDPRATGGYSLAVVDTRTMHVTSRYRASGETFYMGVAVVRDPLDPANALVLASGGPSNAVYALDLDDAGRLTPDAHHVIRIPAPTDANFPNAGKAFPSGLVASPDGRYAYVVDDLGNDVVQIDVAKRAVAGAPVAVGFFPFAAALGPTGVLVANEGLMRYANLPAPAPLPPFALPQPDLARASSLAIVPTGVDGAFATPASIPLPLDRTPDGVHQVGGAHPAAIAAMQRRPYAFVAMSNVDRVATVLLTGAAPHAVGGTELRLYDRGPYGTQPDALALSRDEKRLYVALAGIDAVAVLDTSDPLRPHRIGLIPTGWYPSALALSPDGRYLYVANAKGLGNDAGFKGDRATYIDARGRIESVDADSNAIWSTLERIDLRQTDVRRTTPLALAYLRAVRPAKSDPIVPQQFSSAGSSVIKHVVVILEENKTYDAMLGDLKDPAGMPYGPGDPGYVAFDESITPNLHALARTFALAGNFYADAEESDAGHQFAAAGIASAYTEKTLLVKDGRRPLVDKNEDLEDYPRAGYIFNSLANRGLSYRDYGDFVRVLGYDEGAAPDPKTDDPAFAGDDDAAAPTQGLGGLYALDAPALAALAGHVDVRYPGWNLRVRDVRRAQEFVRDFDPLVKLDQMPAFTYVWLPDDHGGFGKDIPVLPEEVADGDRALGRIVEYLTHVPQWSSTAIFIMPDDAQSTRDHVDEHRSYAIVVSPYAKRHVVGPRHLSTVSALKTEEEILGLPALSLGDALATDMSDLFTPVADATPFEHVDAAVQTGSLEGKRIAALLARTDQSAPDADGPRAAALVELSREADRLAAHRASYDAAAYARLQGTLFERARAIVALR